MSRAMGLAALAGILLLPLAAPAAAFDCKRASTASEKAICADPAALAADSAMSAAFDALRKGLAPPARAALIDSQAQWIRQRDDDCSNPSAQLGACLAEASRKRAAFLSGAPLSGPGGGKMAPAFFAQKGRKGKAEIAIESVEFVHPASPGETLFNTLVAKIRDDAEDPDPGEPWENYAFTSQMQVAYASPQFISAHADNYSNTNGAHGNPYSHDFNIDLRAGKVLTLADLLDPAGVAKIDAICVEQLIKLKNERRDGDKLDADGIAELRKSVADTAGELGAWSFSADAATVTFDPYTAGSYAEGTYTCRIPYATLRPLARPDFPLP